MANEIHLDCIEGHDFACECFCAVSRDAGAYVLLPHGVYIGKSPDSLDWMWLILLAGMMLGVYFLTVGVALGNKKMTR